jgi:hypothetical protein
VVEYHLRRAGWQHKVGKFERPCGGWVGDYLSLAVFGSSPHVFYYQSTGGNNTIVYAYKSAGIWNNVLVANGAGKFGSIALDNAGHAHFSYIFSPSAGLLHAFHNGSVMATVNEVVLPYSAALGGDNSLALDSAGRPFISHCARYFMVGENSIRSATFSGGVWLNTWVDSSKTTECPSSIAVTSTGSPVVVYASSNHTLYYAFKQFITGRWYWVSEEVEVGTTDITSVSLVLDAADNPHIVYSKDGTPNLIMYAYKDTTWHTQVVYQPLLIPGLVALAIAPNGNEFVAFTDAGPETLYAGHRDNSTRSWTFSAILDTGVWQGLSLKLFSNGDMGVAYTRSSTGLRFGRITCTTTCAGTPLTIDAGTVESVSIAIDHKDRAHISYALWDVPSQTDKLKYAYSNGATWVKQVLDSVGSGSIDTALALSASGKPRISYSNSNYGELKYIYQLDMVYLPVAKK